MNTGPRAVRPEGVQNGPRTDLQFGGRPVSVKEVGANEPAIHGVHMAIDHIAGAVGVREVEGQEKGILLGAELFDRFKSCATDRLSGPSEKVSDLLAEVSGCFGMIDIPDLLLDGWKEGLQPFFAAVTDLDESVQETLDDHDGGKERSPSVLGGLPTVGVDRLGHIGGRHVANFFSKSAIGLGQRCFIGAQRQGSTQHTIVAHGRRNIAFLAVEMDMFFIGQQMLGQLVAILDRRTDDLTSSETSCHPVPVAVISSEHVGQRPKGHGLRDAETRPSELHPSSQSWMA